jgi:hypothetical protein
MPAEAHWLRRSNPHLLPPPRRGGGLRRALERLEPLEHLEPNSNHSDARQTSGKAHASLSRSYHQAMESVKKIAKSAVDPLASLIENAAAITVDG